MTTAFDVYRSDGFLMATKLFGIMPDPWQKRALDAYVRHDRLALVGSRGVGVTTVLSLMAWHFLLTRPRARVVVADRDGNLQDNLGIELYRYYQASPVLRGLFEYRKRSFEFHSDPNWRLDLRPWRFGDHLPETLAGVVGRHILFLIDGGAYTPRDILPPALGCLQGIAEGRIVVGGIPDPDPREARLIKHVVRDLGWPTVRASGDPDDPDRSPRVSESWARGMIASYGREHPIVRMNVFGQFPDEETKK